MNSIVDSAYDLLSMQVRLDEPTRLPHVGKRC